VPAAATGRNGDGTAVRPTRRRRRVARR